jgi:Ca2+-binding EF-hand superfamily protein
MTKLEVIRRFDQALLEMKVSPSLVFRACDIDKSGSIKLEELQAVVRKMGIKIDPEVLSLIFKELDINGNGQLEELEFYGLFKQSRNH